MMLTIRGLPPKTKYHDLKVLIRNECNISDFILDNLVDDDGYKKVRIGLADDSEGYRLMKCLNGMRMSGNFILNVEPVGKLTSVNPGQINTFEPRSGSEYPNTPRHEYPNQLTNNYHMDNSYDHGTGGAIGPHRSVAPSLHSAPGSMDVGRPSPWVAQSSNGQNQWSTSQPISAHVSQNSFGYQPTGNPPYGQQHASHHQRTETYAQGRPQQDSTFSYPAKSNMPDHGGARQQDSRAHVLRNVEIVDSGLPPAPSAAARYAPSQITIMKDNFQASSPYNAGNQQGPSYPSPNQVSSQSWSQQGQQSKLKSQPFSKTNVGQYEKPYDDDRRHLQHDKRPDLMKSSQQLTQANAYKSYDKSTQGFLPSERRISPSGRHISPIGGRISPSERRVSPSGRYVHASGRHSSPSGRRIAPSGRHNSPSGRGISPPGRRTSPPRRSGLAGRPISPSRRVSPSGRQLSPSGRHILHPGRRVSPHDKEMSPPRRRISPSGRRTSPSGRRMSPSGRRMSPSGKRVSPSGRRTAPPGRHISPSGRRISPSKRRMSPLERRVSPDEVVVRVRRASPCAPPSPARFSPSRKHSDKLVDKYTDPVAKVKQVRPAYEPVQASNQDMYSGGFRSSDRQNVQYPPLSHRQQDQRISAWQQEKDKNVYPVAKKQDDDILDVIRNIPSVEKRHSPRKSRSPIRRDRSPIRDRYKRHSPSPRSPRRSWALEKRRSPDVRDAPPPPVWPGQNIPEDNRSRFDRIDDKPKHSPPMWIRQTFEEKPEERMRLEENRTPFDTKICVRSDLMRERGHGERFQHIKREPKISPHDDFEHSQSDFRRSDDIGRKLFDNRQDIREFRRSPERDERRRHEEFRRESPRRDVMKAEFNKDFDPEFEDIYKRTQEFKRKAEKLRKSNERRREEKQTEDQNRRNAREDKNFDVHLDDSSRPIDDGRQYSDQRSRPEEYRRFREKEPEWNDEDDNHKIMLSQNNIAKREKAAEEIIEKLMDNHTQLSEYRGDYHKQICIELKAYLMRLFMEMFGDKDVSFIEIVIKFRSRFNEADEAKMIREVLAGLPSQFRSMKRPAPETSHVPQKTARHSPVSNLREEVPRQKLSDPSIPDWNINIEPPKLITIPVLATPHVSQVALPQLAASELATQIQMSAMVNPQPMMVPAPFALTSNSPYDNSLDKSIESYNLFLCQDDFEPITEIQGELLKNFLISQIIKVSEEQQGWAPDLTLKGIQSMLRYEISTKDKASKEWLINLDFSEFAYFNVLVYTKEQLWYERAAIWLPGHTRYKKTKSYEKLILQNKKLEDVNICDWKFVKEIITIKGTRLYVDMPPSSARALEKYKMQLSYELQKVSVFLKAVAVDKEAFDTGLKEPSITDESVLAEAVQNSPMPLITYSSTAIKITINGTKNITIKQARKIKEIVIYQIYKYLKEGGYSRTDFIKYGFFSPNYFSIEPENAESRRWLLSRHFGELNRRSIVAIGGDEDNTRFFKMSVWVPHENGLIKALVFERIKQSNQGVKGVNFHLWKALRLWHDKRYAVLDIHMDLESVETMIKLKYTLDYVDSIHKSVMVTVKSEYSQSRLEESIKKFKAELSDSYVVANMELDSEEDDDVICLD